jgi:bifunctional non-homologous end joining protein LigD
MPLAVFSQAFDHPDWLFELKYDGFRALAYIENRSVDLVSARATCTSLFRVSAVRWQHV